MSKNKGIRANFLENMEKAENLSEHDLNDRLNETMVEVEVNENYTTREKLKIYELLSSLSNCEARERNKFIRKLGKAL